MFKPLKISGSAAALILAAGLGFGITACSPSPDETRAATQNAAKPELGTFGVALSHMDTSVKPGDNFFHYVNGSWLAATEIPSDKSNYGAFNILGDRSEQQVQSIIQDMAKESHKAGSEEQKIGDLYAAFMDTETIEAKGMAPVQAGLERIRKAMTRSELAAIMGDPSMSISAPIGGWVDVDLKDNNSYIFYLTQSGLGMPSRDNYLDKDAKALELRAAYTDYLDAMLGFAGESKTRYRAEAVLNFETEMAKLHWEPAKRRNKDLTYNKKTMEELKTFAPGLEWDVMLGASGLGDQTHFIVREEDAIQGLAALFAKTDVSTIRDYMTAHYIGAHSAYLPKSVDEASFAFYGKALRGTEEQRERWKRGVSLVSGVLGEAIGKVYVERHFKPDAKAKMDDLVENLRAAFKDGLDGLDWMGEDTKKQAQDKLAKFNPKIGYPDEWTDYSDLQIDRDDLIGSVKSANRWAWEDMVSDLGGPIDRGEWGMTPQTVNAYYRPTLNEIVFPAAILQAPFFDPAADPAVNYGGIGAVIGHEMGHGFDDQGAKTDGNGEQRDWWSAEDKAAFKTRTDALVGQYNAFEVLPDLHINGEFTLGENIGDLTGITMAYAAYKKSLNGKEAPVIDGFTGDQRFFLAYGQIWMRKFTEDELRNRIKTDPHSPGEWRANGIVRNFDPWYAAFNIGPEDALYLPPEERVKIW